MIEIMTEEEENALEPLLSTSHPYWIGLSDYSQEGNLKIKYIKLFNYYLNNLILNFRPIYLAGKPPGGKVCKLGQG